MSEIDSLLDKIQQLENARRFPVALENSQQALRRHPASRQLQLKTAHLLEICKDFEQAFGLYQRIHDETQKSGNKSELPLVLAIGMCMVKTDRFDVAGTFFEELNQKIPENADVLAGLGIIEKSKGDTEGAIALLRQSLKINPVQKHALFELAKILLDQSNEDEAIQLLERNIDRVDVHGESIDLWLEVLEKKNKNRYAQDKLEIYANKYPTIVEFVYGFAVLANRAGEFTLARPAFEQAMVLSPGNSRILYELGVMERIAGNLERSQELIGQSLALQPDNPAAIRTFGSDLKMAYGDENYKRLNYVAAKFSEFSPIEQLHLHYAMAKGSEDVGELDTAFRHYGIAGSKKRKIETYSDTENAKLTQVIMQVVTPHNLALAKEVGCPSETPVFILGMPRSGTSLMEQILSSHPDVFGAGELKFLTGILENMGIGENKGIRLRMGDKDPVFDYEQNTSWALRGEKFVEKLEKLADRPAKRIVDKMPGNFNFTGLINAILPNAKIIHSRRHPIETCLSCYRIHFAEGHYWSYNQIELGRFYRRYWNLMKFWRENFPGMMLEIRYEDNVADVEGQAKKIIDYLGLDWDDNCLNFYNTDRPVKTASVTQVRKPIYNTSTNRWRKYEKYLGPLLGEIGDIVEEYEAEIAHLLDKK